MRGSVHVITRGQLDYGSVNKRKNPNFNLQRIYFGPNLARSRPHGTQRYRAEQLTRSSATRPPRALRFEMCALHAFLCLAVIGSASALEGAAGDALPLSGYSELNRVRRVEAEEAAAAAPDEQDEPLLRQTTTEVVNATHPPPAVTASTKPYGYGVAALPIFCIGLFVALLVRAFRSSWAEHAAEQHTNTAGKEEYIVYMIVFKFCFPIAVAVAVGCAYRANPTTGVAAFLSLCASLKDAKRER